MPMNKNGKGNPLARIAFSLGHAGGSLFSFIRNGMN